MDLALGAAAEANHFAFDDALGADWLSLPVAGDADHQNAHRLPVEKYRDDMDDQGDQQRNRQWHVDIQPNVEPRFELNVATRPRNELLLLEQLGVELMFGLGLLAGELATDDLHTIRRCSGRTMRVASTQLPPPCSADSRALRRRKHQSVDTVGQRQRKLARLAIEIGDANKQHLQGIVAEIVGHYPRKPQVGIDAVEPAEDHHQHQYVRQRGHVPAELECGVQRDDNDQGGAQVAMCREPALHHSGVRRIAALANAEIQQPEDQQRADRTQRIAEPGTSVTAVGWAIPGVRRDRDDNGDRRDLEIAVTRVCQYRLVRQTAGSPVDRGVERDDCTLSAPWRGLHTCPRPLARSVSVEFIERAEVWKLA